MSEIMCKGMDAVAFQDGDCVELTLCSSEEGRTFSTTPKACPRRIDTDKGDLYGPYCAATHVRYSSDVADGDSQFADKLNDTLRKGCPRSADWKCLPDGAVGADNRARLPDEGMAIQGAVRFPVLPGGSDIVDTSRGEATCLYFCSIVKRAALKAAALDKGKELEIAGQIM